MQIPCLSRRACWLPAILVATFAGCNRPQPAPVPSPDPVVFFERVKIDDVIDYEEFTGRTEAVQSVELRSRVTGYLDKVHFKDGETVAKGKLLFTIDDRLYRAELDRAEANVKLADAHLARVQRDFVRIEALRSTQAVTSEEFDKVSGDRAESEASQGVARAARRTAQQNLDYTKITAPINGRISRRFADEGNLIKADDTALSLLLMVDPVYVYFDVDDRTLLAIRRAIGEGKLQLDGDSQTAVDIGLPDEDAYAIRGRVNFIDNKVDAGTGTLRFRAIVPNANLLLSPGLFVRVKLPISEKQRSMLVPEIAIGTNQGQKFVYTLNEKDEIVERRVKRLGKQYAGYRVLLESEVREQDRIVVKGLQRVRQGIKTEARPEPAPPAKPGVAAPKSAPPPAGTAAETSPTPPARAGS